MTRNARHKTFHVSSQNDGRRRRKKNSLLPGTERTTERHDCRGRLIRLRIQDDVILKSTPTTTSTPAGVPTYVAALYIIPKNLYVKARNDDAGGRACTSTVVFSTMAAAAIHVMLLLRMQYDLDYRSQQTRQPLLLFIVPTSQPSTQPPQESPTPVKRVLREREACSSHTQNTGTSQYFVQRAYLVPYQYL